MLLYTGLAWCADAMEMMLLSFLGPAVSFLQIRASPVLYLAFPALHVVQIATAFLPPPLLSPPAPFPAPNRLSLSPALQQKASSTILADPSFFPEATA